MSFTWLICSTAIFTRYQHGRILRPLRLCADAKHQTAENAGSARLRAVLDFRQQARLVLMGLLD